MHVCVVVLACLLAVNIEHGIVMLVFMLLFFFFF